MLKIVKYNTKKEESQMMKDFFTPDEFLNSNYLNFVQTEP